MATRIPLVPGLQARVERLGRTDDYEILVRGVPIGLVSRRPHGGWYGTRYACAGHSQTVRIDRTDAWKFNTRESAVRYLCGPEMPA